MERFFSESAAIDYAELIEFALREYPYEVLSNMDFQTGCRVLSIGFEKERKRDLWRLYCNVYPHMDDKHFVDFDAFVAKVQPRRVRVQTREEIMSGVANIIELTT